MPSDGDDIIVERAGFLHVSRRADVPLAAVLDAVATPGETLKRNEKSHTKCVGGYVVKSSEGPFALQLIKHTAQRSRYRRGWRAAQFLHKHGVPAPRPVAHVEWAFAGAIWRHATVTEYVSGCQDVEHFYDELNSAGTAPEERAVYLLRLAGAVNMLTASGAVHTDLAGKNILTRDGTTFYFIDMDGIVLNTPFGDEQRLQCHVQLYDSFVDRCDDTLLTPFLRAMLPTEYSQFETWLARVKAEQAIRRARTIAAWKREGKLQ